MMTMREPMVIADMKSTLSGSATIIYSPVTITLSGTSPVTTSMSNTGPLTSTQGLPRRDMSKSNIRCTTLKKRSLLTRRMSHLAITTIMVTSMSAEVNLNGRQLRHTSTMNTVESVSLVLLDIWSVSTPTTRRDHTIITSSHIQGWNTVVMRGTRQCAT